MKYTFLILILCSFGCNQNPPSQKNAKNKLDITKENESVSENKSEYLKIDTLCALEIVNPESKNVYQKYGIDFGGTCYACDVADVVITGENIRLVNVCNKEVTETFLILSSVETKNGFKLSSTACEFIFSKLSDAPIYELKITGKMKSNRELRIHKYYTTPTDLLKFGLCDCEDFQG